MPSVTAQFLFAGFNGYLKSAHNTEDTINKDFSGGGLIESAYLLESIAAAADKHIEGIKETFPGVWEYEVVEEFGSTLAAWADAGDVKPLDVLSAALCATTDAWIKTGICNPEMAVNTVEESRAAPSDSTPDVRGRVVAIAMTIKSGRCIHFCNHTLLSGRNADLWFPVAQDESWFAAIERIMTINAVAHNVTSITPLTSGDTYTDYEIIFNRTIV